MYGLCKNCNLLFSCQQPRKWSCGFCETDFEPKPKPQAKTTAPTAPKKHMQWVQTSSTKWEAVGEEGSFYIERSHGLFWGRYSSEINGKSFKMKPKKKLREAKEQCEENFYWE